VAGCTTVSRAWKGTGVRGRLWRILEEISMDGHKL